MILQCGAQSSEAVQHRGPARMFSVTEQVLVCDILHQSMHCLCQDLSIPSHVISRFDIGRSTCTIAFSLINTHGEQSFASLNTAAYIVPEDHINLNCTRKFYIAKYIQKGPGT